MIQLCVFGQQCSSMTEKNKKHLTLDTLTIHSLLLLVFSWDFLTERKI